MRIGKDTVVTLDYRVTDSDANTVDEGAQPLVYLHGGYGGLFAALESALEGKETGEVVTARLEPDQAFGEYDAELISVESRDLFPATLEVGMQFERVVEGGDEETALFTVTDIADGKVVVDGNHPLAGMVLVFHCTVAEVRPATAEEIGHGHTHD